MKKLTAYVLVFVLTFTTIGIANVNAEEQKLNWNGYIYQIHTDTTSGSKHILIEDYIGTDKNLILPEKIEGLPVTQLAERFTCTADILTVKVNDTLEEAEGLAWCDTLEQVLADSGSTRYQTVDGILYDKEGKQLICYPSAKKDRNYVIPKTVISDVGFHQLFLNHKYLKEVTFTGFVPELACAGTNIEKVTISGKISYIPDQAFAGCKKLKNVTIGGKVAYIGVGAFQGCTALTSIKLPDSLKRIWGSAFENTSLKSVKLPKRLQTIRDYAFKNTKIKKVTIPKSVDYIGRNAFPRKTKLKIASYMKKVYNQGIRSQYGYRAYVTAKGKSGTKKYRAAKVTKITTDNKRIKLKKGRTYVLKTEVFVSKKKKSGYIKNDILEFVSSNGKVVKVTKGGKLKALKKGTVTVTVKMRTSAKRYRVKVRVL